MNLVIVGGSGSLGRAILQQQDLLKDAGIHRIRIISRDEAKQAIVEQSYQGSIPLDCFLGDASDYDRMEFALQDSHFVIHAAAQKRIEKFEKDIPQGYKTNIGGTHAVAEGFRRSKYAVAATLVSTDKACDPTTAYGVSKLAAEHLFNWYNTFQGNVTYKICRYGNVFGSRGSIIERWIKQAKAKEPMTMTDLECTRFFITLRDAARFVIDKTFHGSLGINIPPMKSALMVDVASCIWERYNANHQMHFNVIGLRGQEKKHEALADYLYTSEHCARFTTEEINAMLDDYLQGGHHA